jgi:hypothetical protein
MTADVATSVNASSRVWMSYSIMKLQAQQHTQQKGTAGHTIPAAEVMNQCPSS